MKKCINDLTGKRFGNLVVIGLDTASDRRTKFICACDCGNVKSIRSDALLSAATTSCGCAKKKQDAINLSKHHSHKMSGTRIYSIWQGMKGRCFNEKDARYSSYGGRGIIVCDEWKNDFTSFYNWAIGNGYSDSLTIERINNDGNYEPSNCRWATNEEQCNNRRTNIKIKIGNSERTLKEWCDIFELDYKTINARYHRNEFNGIDDLFN